MSSHYGWNPYHPSAVIYMPTNHKDHKKSKSKSSSKAVDISYGGPKYDKDKRPKADERYHQDRKSHHEDDKRYHRDGHPKVHFAESKYDDRYRRKPESDDRYHKHSSLTHGYGRH